MHKINDLSDYSAIKKLASALHKFNSNQHGAAIMVGAGFSRSAARHVGGEKKMPLWNDFSKRLVAELNPNVKDFSFSDPLRVAEEYRAYFGQAALNDRIRSEINDDAWSAGELYKSLLELPWSEIMTTNWDTLLERAAKDVHSPYYTPVTKVSDLAWAPSPRIVKLHGTIGITDTFIAAQEDYRTYPAKFAPFVNFARQVFIENELCLLGFSGDDPNFLQWVGWVRDHLAGHARKIYLVGAFNLNAARRKHLESINVAPIDLWDAVKHLSDDPDLMHRTAAELFLRAMESESKSKVKPHEWMPSNLLRSQVSQEDHIRKIMDPEYAAELLREQLDVLRRDRESYPGWLVCPPALIWHVKSQINDPFPTAKNIEALSSDDREKLLYEIAWRYSITFEYIPLWLVDFLFKISNPDEPCAISKRQQSEIALWLLRNSRWLAADNEEGKKVVQEHIKVLTEILGKHAQYLPDCAAELAYHQALVARDALDYTAMEVAVRGIAAKDPIWKIRRASLLMELGGFDEGSQLIVMAYGELRESYRRDRHSIPILSRLVWAHWLLEATHRGRFEPAPAELPVFAENMYRKWKCDPWTWIESIRDKAISRQEKYLKEQNPIEPSFEQGRYRDNSKRGSLGNEDSEFFLLNGFSSSVGIPLRSGSASLTVNLLTSTAEKLVMSGGGGVELWDYTLAIRAASSESSPSIKEVFTRIGVASASGEVMDTLVVRILTAIEYWSGQRRRGAEERRNYAISALRVLIEVLARLVVRATPERAKDIFRLAISLGKQQDFQHPWLFEVIDRLLMNSLKSIPESRQGEMLVDALSFPLPREVGVRDFPRWPNPVIYHPGDREEYPGIDARMGELIDAVRPSDLASCASALWRLSPLVRKDGFLTRMEREKLAKKIWGEIPDYKNIPNIGLNLHALLMFPAPDEKEAKALIQRNLYEQGEGILADAQKDLQRHPSIEVRRAVNLFSGMANAAANEITRLFPTEEQAITLFDHLMEWRPWEVGDDTFGFEGFERDSLIESIGEAISYAIVPAISVDGINAERFERLKLFYSQVDGCVAVLPSFVYFASLCDSSATSVEKVIQKAMQDRDARKVGYAASALQRWMELPGADRSLHLNRLISRLIVIIESGRTTGLPKLIWVAGELVRKNLLSEDQVRTLVEAVPNAFHAADYSTIEPSSREAISASSIREASIRLANTLISQYPSEQVLHDLIGEAETDSLPEVRFAISMN